jgi:hypothetical protein
MAGDHGPFRFAADNKPVRRATTQSSYGEGGMRELRNYSDGVDGAPTGIDVPRWSLSQSI